MSDRETKEMKIYNVGEKDKNDFLWKFVSIEKFLSIILNSKLYFNRIDGFEDLQEGISPELLLLNHQKDSLMKLEPIKKLSQIHSIDMFPRETDLLIDKLKEIQQFNFANCWHSCKDNIESVAMWNLYSEVNSVALNINFEDLYTQLQKSGIQANVNLKSFTMGKVKYLNFQDSNELDKAKDEIENTAFLKDISFGHENEFRFVAEIDKYPIKPFSPKEGISKYKQKDFYDKSSQIYGLDVLLRDFFDYKFEIVFHPKMEEWVKSDLKKIIKKFNVPFNTRDSKLKIK
jgi:hypothetical protein